MLRRLKPSRRKRFEVRAIGDPRIDFDSDFAVGRKRKALARVAEEIFHLRGGEIGRRAAAPVKLHHRRASSKPCALTWSISLFSASRYGSVTLLSFWMDTLQAQNRHRFSQKGRCM